MDGQWIEVFRAGKQTDSAGRTREWSEADLDHAAASNDPANHEAPVVVGHPKERDRDRDKGIGITNGSGSRISDRAGLRNRCSKNRVKGRHE